MEACRYEQKLIYLTLDFWVAIIARLKQSKKLFPKLWTCLISLLLWWSFCGSVLLFKFNLLSLYHQSFSFSIFCKQKWILEVGLSEKKPSLFQELNPMSTGYGNAESLCLLMWHILQLMRKWEWVKLLKSGLCFSEEHCLLTPWRGGITCQAASEPLALPEKWIFVALSCSCPH